MYFYFGFLTFTKTTLGYNSKPNIGLLECTYHITM